MCATSSQRSRPRGLRQPGDILLISCYELGQQPLGIAVAAARLEAEGFLPDLMDISVESFDAEKARRASLVGISVPMHTALRLGMRVAQRVRSVNPRCHISFYGLYAALNAEHLLETVADSCFGGEFEDGLVRVSTALHDGGDTGPFTHPPDVAAEVRGARRTKRTVLVPSRKGLPPLERYVALVDRGERRKVGYVTTTRGCKHLCLHCPVPSVYEGAFFATPTGVVLDDISQLVASGATHITFGDPDFLNGPTHARRTVRAMHGCFPSLTFDYTAKVEHLLAQRALLCELRELGCAFVVSAIESLSDATLSNLAKGHCRRDVVALIELFRDMGLVLRPSLLPFTPWDTIVDYRDLLGLIEDSGMVDHVDPVQYGIRLLVPPGSPLVRSRAMRPHLEGVDHDRLTHRWRHPDPGMDALQRDVARVTEEAAASGEDVAVTFYRIKHLAHSAPGTETRHAVDTPGPRPGVPDLYPADRVKPPRLSENWFC